MVAQWVKLAIEMFPFHRKVPEQSTGYSASDTGYCPSV